MKEVNSYNFKKYVCQKENIPFYVKYELSLPRNKKTLKEFTSGCATNCEILVDGKLLPYISDKSCPSTRNILFNKASKIVKTQPISLLELEKKCNKIRTEKLKNYYPHRWITKYNNEIYVDIDND